MRGNTCQIRSPLPRRRDHPRVCGEHCELWRDGVSAWGSSRVCGEHMREMERAGESPGSSPRMRGTRTWATISRTLGDHPRVCGEHIPLVIRGELSAGSSPRMRGTPYTRVRKISVLGIIPAYAGTHLLRFVRNHGSGIIPAYAGNTLQRVDYHHIDGIIPAYAGNTLLWWLGFRPWGIIPAYAGNTFLSKLSAVGLRDHPRVCGEHGDFARYASHANESQADSSGTASRGSSPRMRGTLHLSIDFRHVAGIIPAYAGNTVLLSMPR